MQTQSQTIQSLSNENGIALVLLAITLPMIVIITALSLDGGSLFIAKSQLQNTLDIAVVSAANEFMYEQISTEAEIEAYTRDSIRSSAVASAWSPEKAELLSRSVDITITFPSIDRVRVTAQGSLLQKLSVAPVLEGIGAEQIIQVAAAAESGRAPVLRDRKSLAPLAAIVDTSCSMFSKSTAAPEEGFRYLDRNGEERFSDSRIAQVVSMLQGLLSRYEYVELLLLTFDDGARLVLPGREALNDASDPLTNLEHSSREVAIRSLGQLVEPHTRCKTEVASGLTAARDPLIAFLRRFPEAKVLYLGDGAPTNHNVSNQVVPYTTDDEVRAAVDARTGGNCPVEKGRILPRRNYALKAASWLVLELQDALGFEVPLHVLYSPGTGRHAEPELMRAIAGIPNANVSYYCRTEAGGEIVYTVGPREGVPGQFIFASSDLELNQRFRDFVIDSNPLPDIARRVVP